jgi:hypothetical protein
MLLCCFHVELHNALLVFCLNVLYLWFQCHYVPLTLLFALSQCAQCFCAPAGHYNWFRYLQRALNQFVDCTIVTAAFHIDYWLAGAMKNLSQCEVIGTIAQWP